MIRTMALIVAFASFAAIGARAGDVTLAANAVLYKMFTLGSYFLDGTATAAEAMGGQGLWRAQPPRLPPLRRHCDPVEPRPRILRHGRVLAVRAVLHRFHHHGCRRAAVCAANI